MDGIARARQGDGTALFPRILSKCLKSMKSLSINVLNLAEVDQNRLRCVVSCGCREGAEKTVGIGQIDLPMDSDYTNPRCATTLDSEKRLTPQSRSPALRGRLSFWEILRRPIKASQR